MQGDNVEKIFAKMQESIGMGKWRKRYKLIINLPECLSEHGYR